ncbi:hypothetical protein SAMN05660649_01299 [Desulfotomaculum arcticum]|uniref:Uncharacterized protein n=1 Tax=Desulfotruncus arcticus DSM 17038 TaxID=1121424 RepID=A0A1I2QLV4_9FIRM|nr:hypothetical protein [Desulfotruncus arcticus]SFG29268.1 hypothetical protein SAMN05660649_01299 [Desulfotomaculum arcticum] [Desulfotruncus arcticus DSM 17038]
MVDRTCEDCPMKDLRKIHRLVEKRALEKLPEEVREPLLEVKKQMRLVLRGLIGHTLGERTCYEKHSAMSRQIKLE